MAIAIIPSIIFLSPYKCVCTSWNLKPGFNGIRKENHITKVSSGQIAAPYALPGKLGAESDPPRVLSAYFQLEK
jgi:hypothetical protein